MSTTTGASPRETAAQRPPVDAWLPLAAVAVTLLLWASAFVAIRHLGDDFSPGALSLGRLLVGAVCARVSWRCRAAFRDRSRRDLVSIVVIGVLWFGVYNVALNAGERRVDAGTAAMLIQVSPVLIALLAAVFLDERFTVYLARRPGAGLRRRRADRALDLAGQRRRPDRCAALPGQRGGVLDQPDPPEAAVARVSAVQVTWLACTIGAVAACRSPGRLVRQTRTPRRCRRSGG